MKKFLRAICMAFVVVIAGVALTACKPGSVEKAETKMKDAEYTVIAYEVKDAEGFVGGFTASKISVGNGVDFDGMIALLFDSKDNAAEFGENFETESKYGEVKVDGKWVYAGTEDAVKAFLK